MEGKEKEASDGRPILLLWETHTPPKLDISFPRKIVKSRVYTPKAMIQKCPLVLHFLRKERNDIDTFEETRVV